MRKILSGILVMFLCLPSVLLFVGNVFQVSGNSLAPPDDWSMFKHDPQRTGYSMSTAPNTSQVLWIYNTTHEVDSSPAIANGHVVVGVSDGDVVALALKTGQVIWEHSLESELNSIWSSPAIDSGRVYIGSRDNNFYCLNESDGNLIWSFPTGNDVESSPLVMGDRVYFCSNDGYLYCLNAVNGAFVWKNPVGNPGSLGNDLFSSPAILNGVVFVGCGGYTAQNFSAVNALTGDTVWQVMVGGNSAPVIADGKVFFASSSFDSKVYCLDASTGLSVWDATLNFPNFRSSPAVSDGRLFVATGFGRLYCLNVSSGAEIWKHDITGPLWSSPCVADGKVFIGSSVGDGRIYCFDESTGTPVWNHSTIERIVSSPVVSNGMVFVGCGGEAGGAVYAFGTPQEEVVEQPNYLLWIVIAVIIIVIFAVALFVARRLRKKQTGAKSSSSKEDNTVSDGPL